MYDSPEDQEHTNHGDKNTWSFHDQPKYIPEANGTASGWLYLQQNPHSGLFFLGGTAEAADDILGADDSFQAHGSVRFLRHQLNKHFGQERV